MAYLPPPTFKAFKSSQPLITRPVSSWRSEWSLLTVRRNLRPSEEDKTATSRPYCLSLWAYKGSNF